MSEFVHLHLHTAYSLLDGAIKIPELMSRVKEFGMQAVAITDHGTMAGVIDFYQQARKHEIKAILGIEIYVARSDRQKREKENNHLVLLARNITGYRNLLYLSSMAHREGFYYKPRIDLELLRERREGLIGLSACLAGQIPQLILGGKYEQAAEAAKTLADIFEPGGFYLELQENGLPEQATVNNALMKLARELGLPLVATNDCHYLNRDDATAHEVLMCVQTGKKLSDEHRLHHTTDAFYVKSPEEMKSSFSYAAEAVRNSLRIAEACNVELDLGHNYLPRFEVPEGFSDLPAYLRHLAEQGLERRFAESRQPLDRVLYGERLTHELSVIVEMGFTGYFLIVWEFIDYAKRNDIPVGPGRGSGAGSLVAFALRITDIDPIKYNLLFERFLNPERISMPDFDVDFCQDKRELVIKHVTEKYGVENVAQIATFGVLKARAVLKDVGRVLDFSFKDMNDLSKLVPEDPKMTLEKALKESPDFAKFYQDDHYRHLIDISMRLEGLNRHMGIHAAGVVIADKPIWEYVPIWVKDGKDLVSQFAKDEVEQAGLVKFDFLGLKTLTLLAGAVRRIRQRPGEEGFTVEALPLEDAATFALLSSGKTVGVFQVESQGFMELLRGLRPDTLEDIIAAVALYRPGPLGSGMDKDFIRRKHGEEPIVYPHPLLEGVLKETYGVIIYQEQVMQIVQILAGYTLGGADILRRAMGKKKADLMAQHRKVFVDGCLVKNIEERNATEIFDLLEKFADYGFNKSHSAAYALITYQTAYLKCHYPLEFMAALLTTERNDTDKVTFYINEVKDMGGRVLPPDVNRSEEDFTVEQGAIRFGLSAIKNIGDHALETILEQRRKSGPFRDLLDLCSRVDLRKVNRKVLESLVRCGALDWTGQSRAVLFAMLDQAMDLAQSMARDQESGQLNMFNVLLSGGQKPQEGLRVLTPPAGVEEWSKRQMLAAEKELLGFYVSGHPLEEYAGELRRFNSHTVDRLAELEHDAQFVVVVLVNEVETRFNDRKEKWAQIVVEDLHGSVGFAVFPKIYAEFGHTLVVGNAIVVQGRVRRFEGKTRLNVEALFTLDEYRKGRIHALHLQAELEFLTPRLVQELQGLLEHHRGGTPTYLHLSRGDRTRATFSFPERWRVQLSDELGEQLRKLQVSVDFR